jgi:hypothetical protein
MPAKKKKRRPKSIEYLVIKKDDTRVLGTYRTRAEAAEKIKQLKKRPRPSWQPEPVYVIRELKTYAKERKKHIPTGGSF